MGLKKYYIVDLRQFMVKTRPQTLATQTLVVRTIVLEPNNFYAAPAPVKNFDAGLALTPPLLYSKAQILNELKFKHMLNLIL
jgi:hypothetical protein